MLEQPKKVNNGMRFKKYTKKQRENLTLMPEWQTGEISCTLPFTFFILHALIDKGDVGKKGMG